uniref:Large ribosomal subunit protein mL53 n=1 Tax=Fagus sylvatica TaxID=28930 RepID=A0A2N9HJD8_FAGSY
MLKFLSRVRIEFNALDPRTASCMEFLKQCNTSKAKHSNPACQLQVKRRTDDHPPQITVTFLNGVEEVFDATNTPAQTITDMILDKGQFLETEQMFRQAGQPWPIIIPHEEILQPHQQPATKLWRLILCYDPDIYQSTDQKASAYSSRSSSSATMQIRISKFG